MLLSTQRGISGPDQPQMLCWESGPSVFWSPHCQAAVSSLFPSTQVFKEAFWMRLWGGTSPKRSVVFSNGLAVNKLWTGRLCKRKNPSSVKTTERYVDGSGKARFHGTSELKGTQSLGWFLTFWCWYHLAFTTLVGSETGD